MATNKTTKTQSAPSGDRAANGKGPTAGPANGSANAKRASDTPHAALIANLRAGAKSATNDLLAVVQFETAELYAQTGQFRQLVLAAMEQVDSLAGFQEIDKPLQRQFQMHQQCANYSNLMLKIQQREDKPE